MAKLQCPMSHNPSEIIYADLLLKKYFIIIIITVAVLKMFVEIKTTQRKVLQRLATVIAGLQK